MKWPGSWQMLQTYPSGGFARSGQSLMKCYMVTPPGRGDQRQQVISRKETHIWRLAYLTLIPSRGLPVLPTLGAAPLVVPSLSSTASAPPIVYAAIFAWGEWPLCASEVREWVLCRVGWMWRGRGRGVVGRDAERVEPLHTRRYMSVKPLV